MNNIVKKTDNLVSLDDGGHINKLMELALSNNADVNALEKLLDMQERWEARQSRHDFFESLAEFQSSVPMITKSKKGHNYKYAPLPDIQIAIGSLLKKVGLTYRFEQDHSRDGLIEVTCVVTHKGGHTEKTSMTAGYDDTGSKNEIQSRGSTVTYLQRYTLIGAFGLITADEDIDGRIDQSAGYITADQVIEIKDLLKESGSDEAKMLKAFKADAVEHILNSRYERIVRILRSKLS